MGHLAIGERTSSDPSLHLKFPYLVSIDCLPVRRRTAGVNWPIRWHCGEIGAEAAATNFLLLGLIYRRFQTLPQSEEG